MPIEPLSIWEITLRVALAALLGGAIGWDRERQDKAAGIRTMILVSIGACGAMLAALELSLALGDGGVALDPLRVVSGVVGGVGFLGAGAIIQSGGAIHGMTTAATIWASAGIGVAIGAGLYRLALVMTGFVLLTLVVVTAMKGSVLPDKNHPGG
ncbi:MAG: MgtC/SapB family protein [Phycisphaerales bacterium JB059]